MTAPQICSFAVIAGMMALFISGKLRYDLVAILALLASLALGIVSPKDAFSGFSDEIVIIVGSALVVSAAVQRSGVIETLIASLSRHLSRAGSQLFLLSASVGILSGFVKNIGALAMLMPAAFQMAKRTRVTPSLFLMPMSFASLLGGLVTLIGTSPNIVVSRVREEMTGQPFRMFDYAPVGLGLTLAGLLFLRFGYRLLPKDRRATATMSEAIDIKDYVTEARITTDSPAIDETVSEFLARHDNEVAITTMLRMGTRSVPLPDTTLHEDDILILAGEPDILERVIVKDDLELEGSDREPPLGTDKGEIGVIEAIIGSQSIMVDRTAGDMQLYDRYGINLLALSRAGERQTRRLRNIVFRPGDVIVLQGTLSLLPERLRELGCLPLAERQLRLGNTSQRLLPLLVLAAAMGLAASGLVPVAVAFFAAAAAVVLIGALPIRVAYDHIDWPILIMLGALIPVSDSLRTTGATEIISTWLSGVAASLPGWGTIALILVAAMAITPFLNNAATVLVMAPIAAKFAQNLGYHPEAFLMAVAVGAGCDFLTPIGHQCNTLVMGPGGYRFSDYARLGAPLSLIVVLVGVPLLMWFWPL